MKTRIGKSGNSLAVRIPGVYVKKLGLKQGMALDISITARIILRPRRQEYSLDELVSRITEENRHPETEWGPARKREVW